MEVPSASRCPLCASKPIIWEAGLGREQYCNLLHRPGTELESSGQQALVVILNRTEHNHIVNFEVLSTVSIENYILSCDVV
jgi:hypothetical protein